LGDVVLLNVVTRLDIPVQRVLDGAVSADLEEVVVIGYDKEGQFYFSSNKANGGSVLWLLEQAKKELLNA
jgi:hypothetical protein